MAKRLSTFSVFIVILLTMVFCGCETIGEMDRRYQIEAARKNSALLKVYYIDVLETPKFHYAIEYELTTLSAMAIIRYVDMNGDYCETSNSNGFAINTSYVGRETKESFTQDIASASGVEIVDLRKSPKIAKVEVEK